MRLLLALILSVAVPAAANPGLADPVFLVASAELADPNFAETVVLVTSKLGFAGPVGVIVNRRTPLTLGSALPHIEGLAAERMHFGGPVAREHLVAVFRAATPPRQSVEVAPGVYMSFSAEVLRERLAGAKAGDDVRVYSGHAGWTPAQLESEVARGFWKAARPEARAIFSPRPETLWNDMHRRAGLTTAAAALPPR